MQLHKEDEIAQHDFSKARDYRDRQYGIVRTIRELIADKQLVVTPVHIRAALKSLGYNGD
ncbi:MAG: hypothetical protein ACYTG0_30935 [Planctomycetota bacterium]